jgi:hypothetical protein
MQGKIAFFKKYAGILPGLARWDIKTRPEDEFSPVPCLALQM